MNRTIKLYSIGELSLSISDWAKLTDLHPNYIRARLCHKKSIGEALTCSLKKSLVDMSKRKKRKTGTRYWKYNKEKHTAKEWSDVCGIPLSRLKVRLYVQKWTVGQALGFKPPPEKEGAKEKLIVLDLCKKYGIKPETYQQRIRKGMSQGEAIFTPVREYKKNGLTYEQIGKELGITKQSVSYRIKHWGNPYNNPNR